MKRILSLLLAALLLLGALSGCFKKKIPPSEIRGIERFFYTESNGSDFDMRTVYELDYADGYYTAVIKPAGVKEEKSRTVNVDGAYADRLEAILREYGVAEWNGFDEMDSDIMDGIGFTLDVKLADGSGIDAVGYMKWPPKYDEAARAFHGLFLEIYEKYR